MRCASGVEAVELDVEAYGRFTSPGASSSSPWRFRAQRRRRG